jgi:hypothetical protein
MKFIKQYWAIRRYTCVLRIFLKKIEYPGFSGDVNLPPSLNRRYEPPLLRSSDIQRCRHLPLCPVLGSGYEGAGGAPQVTRVRVFCTTALFRNRDWFFTLIYGKIVDARAGLP